MAVTGSSLQSFTDSLSAASLVDRSIIEIAAYLIKDAPPAATDAVSERSSIPSILTDEVWAAGVTYEISEEARKEESTMLEMYADVYGNDRPKVFFKATPSRTVGPNETAGSRADSEWDTC